MSVSYIKSDAVGLRVGFSPRTVFWKVWRFLSIGLFIIWMEA